MSSPSALHHRYLFGPVFSRRLGRSLGVDLLPYKTCSLDCVYCECGPTTVLTTQRAELVPTEGVLRELDAYLSGEPELDYVTFSGSGEPTLHTGLGRIIHHLKRHHPRYRVAVLTNGTLFTQPDVRRAVLESDLLVPSLDGATHGSFKAIDRPASGIVLETVVEGLVALRKEYQGTLVLEVFIVPGVNDGFYEVHALRSAIERIRPEAVHLNRLDRPGADSSVTPAADEVLSLIAAELEPVPVFVVPTRNVGETRRLDDAEIERAILVGLSNRGAVDITTLALLLGLNEGVVAKNVNQMLADRRVVRVSSSELPPGRLVVRAA